MTIYEETLGAPIEARKETSVPDGNISTISHLLAGLSELRSSAPLHFTPLIRSNVKADSCRVVGAPIEARPWFYSSFPFFFLTPATAAKINPDLIPPEVTLSGRGTAAQPTAEQQNAAPGSPPANANPQATATANASSTQATAIPVNMAGGNRQLVNPAAQAGQTGGASPAPTANNRPDPIATIETDKGNIVIRLFRQYAPKSTANFIDLAGKGFFNGLTFHRVEPGFCIQGGDPRGDGFGVYYEQGTNQPRILPLEISPYLKHNAPGVVAMAHFPKNPNTASCQFYITLAAEPQLDGDYSIFGGVIQGMEVANKIVKGDKMNRVYVQEQK